MFKLPVNKHAIYLFIDLIELILLLEIIYSPTVKQWTARRQQIHQQCDKKSSWQLAMITKTFLEWLMRSHTSVRFGLAWQTYASDYKFHYKDHHKSIQSTFVVRTHFIVTFDSLPRLIICWLMLIYSATDNNNKIQLKIPPSPPPDVAHIT